jgi:hypothetical protein
VPPVVRTGFAEVGAGTVTELRVVTVGPPG